MTDYDRYEVTHRTADLEIRCYFDDEIKANRYMNRAMTSTSDDITCRHSIIAGGRAETDPCENGTVGCCIRHTPYTDNTCQTR